MRLKARLIAVVLTFGYGVIQPTVAVALQCLGVRIALAAVRGQAESAAPARATRPNERAYPLQKMRRNERRRVDVSSGTEGLATEPLRHRLERFIALAGQHGGVVPTFTRTFSERYGNPSRAARVAEKTFFQVTPQTFPWFETQMTKNVAWFCFFQAPEHLHFLIADRRMKPGFHHVTFGSQVSAARVVLDYLQFGLPVLLTDGEMSRLTAMLNVARKYPKNRDQVWGKIIDGIKRVPRCTDWVTTAPIGALQPQVVALARRISRHTRAQGMNGQASGRALIRELFRSPSPQARADDAAAMARAFGFSDALAADVDALSAALSQEQADFPLRPRQALLRQTLAERLGLPPRDLPRDWAADLLLHPQVPIVAVFDPQRAHVTNPGQRFAPEMPIYLGQEVR